MTDPYLYFPTINYVINNLNQYSSVSGSSISNGNEHEVYSFQGLYDTHQVNYYYVNDEHLKTVSDTVLGKTYNLLYDALGRCVKRDLNGTTTTYYIYAGEKPIVEYNSSGTIIARTVYGKGIDEILMRKETGINDGNWFYYADDHEGSVTHLLDGRSTPSSQTGNVLEKYAYDAFGVPTFMDSGGNNLNPNATVYNNRFLFTGREYAATYRGTYVSTFSFYEYRARAYNPTLGRFMSEDPKLFDAGDYNLFRYCHNDPIDSVDPMGLQDTVATYSPQQTSLKLAEDRSYNFIMGLMQRQFSSAISAGMAGYQAFSAWSAQQAMAAQVHDPVINGKNYQQSSSREKLVNVMAEQAHDQMEQERANPSVSEVSTYISQGNNGSNDYLGHPLTLQNRRIEGLEGSVLFNKNRGEKDPSPPGYHVVAGIVAQRVFRERMSFRDQNAFRSLGYDGYTVVPGDYRHSNPFYIRSYHYPDEPQ